MKFIQKLDQYAPKVELNLNGNTYQQTTCGGIVSLVSYLAVLVYGATLMNRLANRLDPQITTYDLVTDLSKLGNVTAEEINFDFAIQFWSNNESRDIPLDEIETYFTVDMLLVSSTNWEWSDRPLENSFISCY